MLALILLGVFGSVILLLLAVAKPKQKEDVEARLKRLNPDELAAKPKAPEPESDTPKKEKKDAVADLNRQLDEVFRPLAKKRLTEAQAALLAKTIANAGRYTMTPVELRAWQYKAAAIAPLAAGVFLYALMGFEIPVTPMLMALAGVGGYFFPILALGQEATKRRNQILRQLPTTLDLLTICVEAGLSLQASMVKVVEKTRPSPLRDEIDQALREVQLGRPRAQALKDMAKRINLKEVNSVVLSMVQAEAMGTSIGKSLRVQSEIARENRWTRAQEQAYKAPVKLTFPLVFFIFPTVFIVIFGPVVLDLMSNFMSN
ncbi:MAG: type II secretion system F family protein [Candidatus Sericytochromatia bacterium]